MCNLNFGEQVRETLLLKSIIGEDENKIYVMLSDKDGEVKGSVSIDKKVEVNALVNAPVWVTGVVTTDSSFKNKLLVITEIQAAEGANFAELLNGLSEEKRLFFKRDINQQLTYLKGIDERWYNFLLEVLPKNWIETLSKMGASTIYEAPYLGGALVSCANVSSMVLNILHGYRSRGNGLYETNGSVGMLMAACYLRYMALPEFLVESGGKKTLNGVINNYPSMLLRKLERIIGNGSNYGLTQTEVDTLFDIIECSVSIHMDKKSVTKEGDILRSSVLLYRTIDMIDRELSLVSDEACDGNGTDNVEYFFSEKLDRYLLREKRKDGEKHE